MLALKVWPIAGFILILGACNKASPLAGSAGDISQAAVETPVTNTKSDRPTEAGEGLPGYLIDPARLAIESNPTIWTVTGDAGAVANAKGPAININVWLIKVSKSSAKLQRRNQDWQLNGTTLAIAPTDARGAFQIQGSVSADDLVFVKIEDTAGPQIEYKAAGAAGTVLWIDGNQAKIVDGRVSEQITSQVASSSATTDLAKRIEQVKATGQCRNCDLRGADLGNLQIPNCDLSLSNIAGARFVSSDISGCNFTNSNLSQVDFTQANMAGANLTQTDINGAVFTGANTSGIVGQSIPPP